MSSRHVLMSDSISVGSTCYTVELKKIRTVPGNKIESSFHKYCRGKPHWFCSTLTMKDTGWERNDWVVEGPMEFPEARSKLNELLILHYANDPSIRYDDLTKYVKNVIMAITPLHSPDVPETWEPIRMSLFDHYIKQHGLENQDVRTKLNKEYL